MKRLGPVNKALQAQTVTAEPDDEEEELEPVPVKRTRGKDKQPRGPRKKQKGSNSDSQGRQHKEPAAGLAPCLPQPAPLVLAVYSCACSLRTVHIFVHHHLVPALEYTTAGPSQAAFLGSCMWLCCFPSAIQSTAICQDCPSNQAFDCVLMTA